MLERIDLLERKLANAEARAAQARRIDEHDWAPLVKVSAAPTTATTTEPMGQCASRDEEQATQRHAAGKQNAVHLTNDLSGGVGGVVEDPYVAAGAAHRFFVVVLLRARGDGDYRHQAGR